MNVALIPARGGSKRISRKNVRHFAGKPIIAYSIEAARSSGLFDRIVVSTDDPEIAEVAAASGAEVPFRRPLELADDQTGLIPVIKHAIQWFNERGEPVQYICCILATAPFLTPSCLREGYEKLIGSNKSFVISVASFPYPIQRAVRVNEEGAVEACHPEHSHTRSQDLEETYHDAGQFYWGRAEDFLNDVVVLSPATLALVLPRHLVQDIDTLEDWRRAELMYVAYCQTEHQEPDSALRLP